MGEVYTFSTANGDIPKVGIKMFPFERFEGGMKQF